MKNIETRQKWLRILLGIFSAWVSFILTIAIIYLIVWVFQVKIFEIEISGIPALILFIIALLISIYAAYQITKWQKRYLDNKPLRFSYIVLVILILLTFTIVPAPMIYTIF